MDLVTQSFFVPSATSWATPLLSMVRARYPSSMQWTFVQGMNEEPILKDFLEIISKNFFVIPLKYLIIS